MRVKAIKNGFAGVYRYADEVFDLPDGTNIEKSKWLVKVDAKAVSEPKKPAKRTTPFSLGDMTAAQREADKKMQEMQQ